MARLDDVSHKRQPALSLERRALIGPSLGRPPDRAASRIGRLLFPAPLFQELALQIVVPFNYYPTAESPD